MDKELAIKEKAESRSLRTLNKAVVSGNGSA